MGAQSCSELFISEYCEGSGNNKGFEIYNPTDAPIDLGPYVYERWSNGANGASDELNLQGTIPAYGTWVVVNGQTEDIEISAGQVSPAADSFLQGLANQLDNEYPAPTYMNGDDACVLTKNGVPVDIFGKPGQDPGVAWTDNADAGFTSQDGGTWLTANHTLKRKFEVQQGVTSLPLVFDAQIEWDTLPNNTWSFLSTHACSCDPNATPDPPFEWPSNIGAEGKMIAFNLYPNPSINGQFNINMSEKIERVEIFSQQGSLVKLFNNSYPAGRSTFDVSEFDRGIYLINVYLTGNRTFSQRLLIK